MRLNNRIGSFATVGFLCAANAHSIWATIVTFDAGPDLKSYEATGNPGTGLATGVNTVVPEWSYGTETGPNTATPDATSFTLFPASTDYTSISLPGAPAGSMAGWQYDNPGDLVPVVAVNTTGSTVNSSCCGSYGVNDIWTHPGGSLTDAFTIVRWTAPSAGTVTISGTFLNEGGVATRDYIQVGGVTSASGSATSPSTPSPLTVGTTAVVPGETIDFVTGQNVNGYGANSTSFSGSVVFTTPEPASAVILGLGSIGLLARRRRI